MTHSANPDELENFGKTLAGQVSAINAIISTVDSPLNSIVWTGPAREAFKAEWDSSFKGALAKLNEGFLAIGKECGDRASGVRASLGPR